MQRIILLIAVATTALGINSCEKNHICQKGSGPVVSEERTVSAFSSITLSTSADVFLTQSNVQEVTVTTHENVIGLIKTKVIGSDLIISLEDRECISDTEVDVYISAPAVNNLLISGSGNIKIDSAYTVTSLTNTISGSGNILFTDLTVNDIESIISGSGSLFLIGPDTSSTIDLLISGSGNINTFGLVTRNVNVTISGSGNASIYALDELDVTISGSGNVHYKGHPQLDVIISGSGSVQEVN